MIKTSNTSTPLGLIAIISLCFVSLVITLFTALVLLDQVEDTNLKVNAMVVPVVNDSNNNLNAIPINEKSYFANEDYFISKLLIEYITTRYTVTGNTRTMSNYGNANLTPESITNMSILKEASLMGGNKPNYRWRDAYINFINKKDGELDEITTLVSQDTTRSVRIIKPPKKVKDWWVCEVEFIYKTPTTYSLASARKEHYEIRMNVVTISKNSKSKFKDITTAFYKNPSSIFLIGVNHINKIKF